MKTVTFLSGEAPVQTKLGWDFPQKVECCLEKEPVKLNIHLGYLAKFHPLLGHCLWLQPLNAVLIFAKRNKPICINIKGHVETLCAKINTLLK